MKKTVSNVIRIHKSKHTPLCERFVGLIQEWFETPSIALDLEEYLVQELRNRFTPRERMRWFADDSEMANQLRSIMQLRGYDPYTGEFDR